MANNRTDTDIEVSEVTNEMTIQQLLDKVAESLDVRLAAGSQGLGRKILSYNVNRPGLAFAGFFQQFYSERIQIVGGNEVEYLKSQGRAGRRAAIRKVLETHPPCLILTTGFEPPEGLVELCDEMSAPLLATPLRTTMFVNKLTSLLMREFAPSMTTHGTLVNVYGLGVLITGKSGAGKSECSLELIARGHRLVADDVVIVSRIGPGLLLGRCSDMLRYHMEIHGIGIIDILSMFGAGAVLKESEIDLHVRLEKWEEGKTYERVGIENRFASILGVLVPECVIPIEPGRNLSIIVEAATLNQKIKNAGINVAAQFNQRLIERMTRSPSASTPASTPAATSAMSAAASEIQSAATPPSPLPLPAKRPRRGQSASRTRNSH